MKKLFFFAATLISIAATAQQGSCVTAKQVSANYADSTVTFELKWTTCNQTNHLYRVWVFVDYRPVTNGTKGAWQRATITATTEGDLVDGKSVWVTGSLNGTKTVTLTLSGVPAIFDWCAFATDYPPQAVVDGNQFVTVKGTPPFTFTLSDNSTFITEQRTEFRETPGQWIQTITDATGCTNTVSYAYSGCNTSNINLGTVGFTNNQEWEIKDGNDNVIQTWSAPVTATYCGTRTTHYNAGSNAAGYNADCRNNIDPSYGHIFSWCMVAQYAATLCPSPWRVPTLEDLCVIGKRFFPQVGCPGHLYNSSSLNYIDLTAWGAVYGAYWNMGAWQYVQGNYLSLWGWNDAAGTGCAVAYQRYMGGIDFCEPLPNGATYGLGLRCVK